MIGTCRENKIGIAPDKCVILRGTAGGEKDITDIGHLGAPTIPERLETHVADALLKGDLCGMEKPRRRLT